MARLIFHDKKYSHGFTFIELLISLALSAVIVTSTIALFFTVKKAYLHQEALAILQENARVLSTILGQAITQSGNMGCNHLSDITLTLHGVSEERYGLQNKQGLMAVVPESLLQKKRPDSDVLWIKNTSGEYFLLHDSNENSGKLNLKGKVPLKKGDTIALFDCSHADLFKVWNDPEYVRSKSCTEVIINQSGENIILGKHYDRSARVGIFSSTFYYVGLTNRKSAKRLPVYALYRKEVGERAQELVEGVEFMKIMFGVKIGNSIVYRLANQIEPQDKIASVRIAALLGTVEEVLDKPQPYVLNAQEIMPADGKMRAWFRYEWKI